MKQTILAAVVCLGSAAAFAQMPDPVKVTLPGPTTVGGVTLPAGNYTIKELDHSSNGVFQIIGDKGKSVSVLVEPVIKSNGAPKTEVILKQTETGYKMDSLWIEGSDTGFDFE